MNAENTDFNLTEREAHAVLTPPSAYVWHVWTDGEADMEIPDTPDGRADLADVLKEVHFTGYEEIVIIRKGRYEGWSDNEIDNLTRKK